ncbi:hypothetical protein [Hyphomicrobium denitrificans]|uniref:hypothetical protein n=1 Tax=Hyphomicrobium denitrificans TaxID=53399 RepID=UPI0001B0DD58|nr:hypothetical protein [Hyphomicrobium denitrificans]
MQNDPHLSELKKQTRMMAEKEAARMAAGGLLVGLVMGGWFWGVPGALILPVPLAIALYWSTFRKHTNG